MRTKQAIALAALLAIVLVVASTLAGCGRRTRQVTTQEPSVVTTQAPSESTSTGKDQTPSSEKIDAAKAQALQQQLHQMNSELEGMNMPSDSEFNGSATALQ